MSAFDVLSTYGTKRLLLFLGAVLLFTVLHLLRIPAVLLARGLEIGMRRVDQYLTAGPAAGGPHNDYFASSAAGV